MRIIIDLLSTIIFFIVFKFYGFKPAMLTLTGLLFVSVMLHFIRHKSFDKIQLGIFILALVLTTLSLIFNNVLFFKWKLSIISWVLSIALLVMQFYGEKQTLFHRTLSAQSISVPGKYLYHVNIIWMIYFFILGFVNLYVAYHYSTSTWVYFKLFFSLGSMIILLLITVVYLAPHLQESEKREVK